MSGGPSDAQLATQDKLASQQVAMSSEQLDLARQQYQSQQQTQAQASALLSPYISQQQALATGDRNAALQASLPTISALSKGFTSSRDSLMNTLPPGAARDTALANLSIQKNTGIAGAEASAIQQAPATLAGLGTGQEGFGLQQLGAALSGFGGAGTAVNSAANINNQTIEQENAAKANSLGPLNALFAGVGSAAGGLTKGSDRKLKENIKPLASILRLLARVRICRFDYKVGLKDQIGVIAQEVREIFPGTVLQGSNSLLVDYSHLTAIAIRAIQELKETIDLQESRIAQLESEAQSNIGLVQKGA